MILQKNAAAVAAVRMLYVLLLIILFPALAHAHGRLRHSIPSSGAQLKVAPTELRLTFSEPFELAYARVELLGPSGSVSLGQIIQRADSASLMVVPIRGGLDAGEYVVRWQIAGADGHPTRGEFSFTILPNAPGIALPAAPGETPPPAAHHMAEHHQETDFNAESAPYAVVRWLNFMALLGVLGIVAFQLVLALAQRQSVPSSKVVVEPARQRSVRVGFLAACVLVCAAVLRLLAQSYALHGPANVLSPGLLGTLLTHTLWGWAWLLQLAATVLALIGFWIARSRVAGWPIAAVAAVLLAVTPALSGHAVAAKVAVLPVITDALHILGAGGWLGSLFALVFVGIPTVLALSADERGPAVAALVNAFSPTALFFAGTTIATGVFAAWLHLGAVSQLWQADYGRILLLKLAVLSGAFATGAYNWLRVRPALGDNVGTARLRRSAALELIIAVIVIAVTAVLVATPTPMTGNL